MSVNLYYTQKIRGFQQQKVKYTANSVHFLLTRTKFGFIDDLCHR